MEIEERIKIVERNVMVCMASMDKEVIELQKKVNTLERDREDLWQTVGELSTLAGLKKPK